MKTILLLPLALALPLSAGTSSKSAIGPEPCLFNWFAGASVGYLTDFEEPMYNLQLGADTCWHPGGWNVSLFAEVGYVGDSSYEWDSEIDLVPVTLNAKFEYPLSGNWDFYMGGGLGAAYVDFSADGGYLGDFSDDDWVFAGQVFAGLNYKVNKSVDVFGGARWIYLDDASMSDHGISGDLQLGDDFLIELGARIKF